MALSRSDYNRKIQQREGLFRLLKDMAKDGTIIYIGYSFKDLIVRDILDEIRDEIPLDEMPWGLLCYLTGMKRQSKCLGNVE